MHSAHNGGQQTKREGLGIGSRSTLIEINRIVACDDVKWLDSTTAESVQQQNSRKWNEYSGATKYRKFLTC